MQPQYSPKNNPRVIIIQKLYGKFFNKEEELTFPKHRFKKFIKDVVNGTIERNEVIDNEESNNEETFLKIPFGVLIPNGFSKSFRIMIIPPLGPLKVLCVVEVTT